MKKITKTVQFIKKHFRGFIPIFFLVVTMISCKKDLNPISQTKEGLAQPSSIESECSTLNEVGYDFDGINIVYEIDNDILRFSNWVDFHESVLLLEKKYDIHNNARDLQIPNGLSDEEMDALDEEVGFDPFYTYRQLENQFSGFNSKRKIIEETENTWLFNDMTGLDPDDIDFTFDDAENTLFNQNYEVKVGCNIYKMSDDGLLNLTNPEETMNIESNTNTNQTEAEGCFTNARKTERVSISNHEIKLKVAINKFIFRSSVKAKAVNFRQKSNGKWRRSRTEIAVHIGGIIFDKKCNGNLSIGLRNPTSGFKKRGEIRELYRWGDTNRKTKKHLLAASVELPNLPMSQVLIEK